MADTNNIMGCLVHLLAVQTWILGPVMVLAASENPHTIRNAERAISWQLTLAVLVTVTIALGLVLSPLLFVGLAVIFLLNLYLCIRSAVEASEGSTARYPYTLEL